MTKILVHGFGDYVIPLLEVIKLSIRQNNDIDWSIALPTSHHLNKFKEILSDEKILYMPDATKQPCNYDKNQLANYGGNFYRDLAVDKSYFDNYPSQWKEKNGLEIYQAYKSFLIKIKPDYVLFSNIESYEGAILFSITRELNIGVLYHVHTRNLGKTYWSSDYNEKLPERMFVNEQLREDAKEYLNRFRAKRISAANFSVKCAADDGEKIEWVKKSLPERIIGYVGRLINEPNARTIKTFKVSALNNLPFFRDLFWEIRKSISSKLFHVERLDELPGKYIYYPLQYSPESSINTLSPYFSDQMRVIEAIRMNMPSEYTLVIKEHPSCIYIRKRTFVKELMKKPGILVAKFDLSSEELIKRSDLVLTVSGTSALEAFLVGKPSVTFTDTFFSGFLGGKASFDYLAKHISDKIAEKIDDEYIVECIAKVFSISYDFILRGSDTPMPTMSKGNIGELLFSIQDHISKTADR